MREDAAKVIDVTWATVVATLSGAIISGLVAFHAGEWTGRGGTVSSDTFTADMRSVSKDLARIEAEQLTERSMLMQLQEETSGRRDELKRLENRIENLENRTPRPR